MSSLATMTVEYSVKDAPTSHIKVENVLFITHTPSVVLIWSLENGEPKRLKIAEDELEDLMWSKDRNPENSWDFPEEQLEELNRSIDDV